VGAVNSTPISHQMDREIEGKSSLKEMGRVPDKAPARHGRCNCALRYGDSPHESTHLKRE